jgi:hypothetical protein
LVTTVSRCGWDLAESNLVPAHVSKINGTAKILDALCDRALAAHVRDAKEVQKGSAIDGLKHMRTCKLRNNYTIIS